MMRFVNPYFNRVAISDPAQFYGREEILGDIFSAIGSPQPQSCAIWGERRTGKSSLLLQVLNPEQQSRYFDASDRLIKVWVDFSEEQPRSESEMINILHYALCMEIKRSCGANPDLRDQPDTYLARMQAHIGDHLEVKRCFTEHIKKLKDQKYFVIFVIDEADAAFLNADLGHEAFAFLRSIASVRSEYAVAYVIASRKPLREISKAANTSEFPNIFQVNSYLPLFTPEEARRLVREPSMRVGVPFTGEDEVFIDETAGLHPFVLQITCFHVLNARHKLAGADGPAEEPPACLDYDAVQKRIDRDCHDHFQYIWDHMTPVQQAILHQIARLNHPKGKWFDLDDLERLEMHGYLAKNSQDEPRLFAGAFRRFILNKRPTPIRMLKQQAAGDQPLRLQTWELIEQVEKGLRSLVERHVDHVYPGGLEEYLLKKFPDLYERWFQAQQRDEKSFGEDGTYISTLLDFSYLEDLRQLVFAEWAALSRVMGTTPRDREGFNLLFQRIMIARNALAHFREIPIQRLEHARSACNELLEILARAQVV